MQSRVAEALWRLPRFQFLARGAVLGASGGHSYGWLRRESGGKLSDCVENKVPELVWPDDG